MKVRIRNAEGKYLASDDAGWGFSEDSSKALVLDYVGHNVAQQLAIIRQSQGLSLEAVEVDPKEVLESCDVCRQMISPFNTVFDGKSFICRDCNSAKSLGRRLNP
ncbi:MAG TPA: hypothetical protein VL361_24805 [Candidatus Limnocylindrales bacterium]|nr:hypothetical protein [Candidatus Limnocylindrales bacterium]